MASTPTAPRSLQNACLCYLLGQCEPILMGRYIDSEKLYKRNIQISLIHRLRALSEVVAAGQASQSPLAKALS